VVKLKVKKVKDTEWVKCSVVEKIPMHISNNASPRLRNIHEIGKSSLKYKKQFWAPAENPPVSYKNLRPTMHWKAPNKQQYLVHLVWKRRPASWMGVVDGKKIAFDMFLEFLLWDQLKILILKI